MGHNPIPGKDQWLNHTPSTEFEIYPPQQFFCKSKVHLAQPVSYILSVKLEFDTNVKTVVIRGKGYKLQINS
jgi:hypothetical protein